MSTQQNHDSHAAPATLNEFINSLQRLFKIGIYYPSGHAILDKATQRFMHHLVTLAGTKPSVTIEDYSNTLMLEGIEIDPNIPFVQEFKMLLSTLGLIAITIDREISMEELHEFVRKMLAYKAQVLRAKQFTQISVAELPHSITVKLKEFLARSDASISEDRSGESSENLASFLDSLSGYGLSSEEINQCKTLLASLPSRLTESNIDMSDLPHASWDDVARLLARAVKSGKEGDSDIKSRVETHSNINTLASILQKLERETNDTKSRESINLLVSIIKKPLANADNEEPEAEEIGERIFPEKPSFSVAQIQAHANKNKLHPKVLANIPESTSEKEMLSILMQLAQHEQSLQAQIRIQQLLREILSTKISDAIWTILSNGLYAIVHKGQTARVSSIIRLLVEPLRRSQHANTLHLFFLVAKQCDAKDTETIWPYVVNEILVNGCSPDQKAYHHLCHFAAGITSEEMYQKLPLLQTLESFETNTIAPDIFHAISPRCYTFFAFLLKTDIEQFIGERVVGGLRRNPPDWLSKALVPLLDLSQQEHKLFLYSYLRQAQQKILPSALKKVAAKIITETLPNLPQDKRSEIWVQNTISSLAQLPTTETLDLLNQIASEKKLLFIPEWPAECRKAASAALAVAKKRR